MGSIDYKVYKIEDYNIGKWMGGTTTELSIYPKWAKYSDRQFTWRLSSATVEMEESVFTRLPEYDRVLIVLDNEVVLVHKEQRVARLAQYEQDRFDGGYDTISFGKITDFNLMFRKGTQGFAEVVSLTTENEVIKPEKFPSYTRASESYYCTEGFCVVSFEQKICMLKQGELLVVNYLIGEIDSFGVMGEGKAIRSHIYFNEAEAETEEIQPQNATFRDFLEASKIYYTNFRGSKHIFRRLKTVWYDECLQKSIDKVEKTFITYLIFILGLIILSFGVNEWIGKEHLAKVIFLWIASDLILINPLLYFIALPKPIAAHIKRIDSLTEYEKLVYERQKIENKKVDTLLKKYEITGRNIYKDK